MSILLSQEDGSIKHMNEKYKYVSALFLTDNDEIYDHHYTM